MLDTAYHLSLRTINRLVFFRILTCLVTTAVDTKFLSGEPRYTGGFLDADELERYAGDDRCELPRDFVHRALARGDECYAVRDGDVLAGYGWYSNRPTAVFDSPDKGGEDLRLHFSHRYTYMYKGYTHPDYRGQRLHAIGMTRALDAYRRRGFEGLVSCVESDNYASLKSCYRMGYKDFGRIRVAKLFGRYVIHCSPGCRAYDFRLEPDETG